MGLRNRNLYYEECCFFITSSCWQMQHFLFDEQCFEIVLDNFRFYNQKYKAFLLGYVLMINHIHFIIYFDDKNYLSAYMRDFKKYSSLNLREYIASNKPDFLERMIYQERTQNYKVWENLFDDVWLRDKELCEVKLEYIHLNPVKANLVIYPEDYKYSSAKFYSLGNPKSELLHYCDVF